MDGTALYECVVVIFIAQFHFVLNGFEIGFATQFTVVLLALMTSVGVAGIPSASLVAITVILGVVGIDPAAVGLVWVTDRILDMCRTAVNVYSDTCGAVIIGRTEGEASIYAASEEEGRGESERRE
jgi:Na+/H+-dicarboxylate symporter